LPESKLQVEKKCPHGCLTKNVTRTRALLHPNRPDVQVVYIMQISGVGAVF
jgi:hypothetical protein